MSRFYSLVLPLAMALLYFSIPDGAAADLNFSSARGFYSEPLELSIGHSGERSEIRVTLDGTDPSSSAGALVGAGTLQLRVDPMDFTGRDRAPGVVVRACAVDADSDTLLTPVVTHSYLFINRIAELSPDNQRPGPGWPEPYSRGSNRQNMDYGMDPEVLGDPRYAGQIEDALLDLPAFSVVLDLKHLFDPDSGIYLNALRHGREWERPCSLELLFPDGSEGFQHNAGVRIRGGWSRHNENPKHAFRFFFRNEYGPALLNYPLFGDEGVSDFDKFDLRTAQNYSWSYAGDSRNTFLRDVYSRDSQRDLGQPYTRSRYYHLYINGTYWGLFQTQERPEEAFAASYFGGDPDDYDIIKVDTGENFNLYVCEATSGNMDAWRRLWQACESGFEQQTSYYSAQGLDDHGEPDPSSERLVDVDNLIDYMLCTFYVGDFDGPISSFRGNDYPNNFYAIYNRVHPDGFKYFRHDAEHSLFTFRGVDRTGPYPAGDRFEYFNPQWLHQKLIRNAEYRVRFADRAAEHFSGSGVFTAAASISRLLSRVQQIDRAIIAESARWGDAKSGSPYTRDDHWLEEVEWLVNDYFPVRTDVVVGQLQDKGWSPALSRPIFEPVGGRLPRGTTLKMSALRGTIYYTLDNTDPAVPRGDGESDLVTLVDTATEMSILIPEDDINSQWRRQLDFDDSSWLRGAGGVGYERDSGYESEIGTDVGEWMYDGGGNANANNSCYVRIRFRVDESELATFNVLQLNMRYDDGFIAYINGVRVAEANAPSPARWNGAATGNHEADGMESFAISDFIDRLAAGDNLLAIHGLNAHNNSSDFLISTELMGGTRITSGGEPSPSAQRYSGPIAIDRSVRVMARAEQGGEWSPLRSAQFWVDEDVEPLMITELHYHPAEREGVDDRELEFIEVKNVSGRSLDLAGYRFIDGVEYAFDNVSLEPGSLFVVAADGEAFRVRYGFEPDGVYQGQFSNGGEKVALADAAGDTTLIFEYRTRYPWPRSADGGGPSLVVRDPALNPDLDSGQSWRASNRAGGSPGRDPLPTAIDGSAHHPPHGFILFQNYPNPFNSSTTISFDHTEAAHVRLEIYNMLGQRVRLLLAHEMPAGRHAVTWSGNDDGSVPLASGIYFYRLETAGLTLYRKMLLLQ